MDCCFLFLTAAAVVSCSTLSCFFVFLNLHQQVFSVTTIKHVLTLCLNRCISKDAFGTSSFVSQRVHLSLCSGIRGTIRLLILLENTQRDRSFPADRNRIFF